MWKTIHTVKVGVSFIHVYPDFVHFFTANVSMVQFVEVGHTDSSFMCYSLPMVKFSTEQGGVEYRADWHFTALHLQAFGVENNSYSQGLAE